MSTGLMRPCVSTLRYLALLCVLLGVGSALGQTPISGVIDRNTTWNAAGSPYVLSGEVEVVGGATLTILGGVQVHFEPESRLLIGGEDPSNAGQLLVAGTSTARVRFEAATPDEPAGAIELRPGAAIGLDGGGSVFRFARFISLMRPLTMRGCVAAIQDTLVARAADAERPAVVVELEFDATAALQATRLSVFECAGGGMSITGGGEHELLECRFIDNAGRGLLMDMRVPIFPRTLPTEVLLRACVFQRNSAPDGSGGGARLFGNTVWTIEDCLFEWNTSSSIGGGLSMSGSGDSSVRSTDFLRNSAGSDGGGMFASANELLIEDCRFVDNRAPDDRGGGLATGSRVRLLRCVFERNTARFGGGVEGRAVAVDCQFIDNFAQMSGGAMQITGSNGYGGVIGGIFDSNTAVASGGAIEFAVRFQSRETRIEGAVFTRNSADLGGAIGGVSGRGGRAGATYRLVGNRFDSNLARRGGAIHVRTDAVEGMRLDLSPEGDASNSFIGNTALTGSAIANDSPHAIEADGVCWGVRTASATGALIHDGLDDAALGIVASDPIATVCLDCPQDMDGDGALTIFDFLIFQGLFAIGDPAADFDGDGSLTLFDFLEFQGQFDAGCP